MRNMRWAVYYKKTVRRWRRLHETFKTRRAARKAERDLQEHYNFTDVRPVLR